MAVASLDETQAAKVLRQVEFYFSDSNLPRDNFLKKTVQESEDGLVSLALICSFARMRTHLGLGEVKPDEIPEETVMAVAETLRKSNSLKISEDGKKIGRSSELSKPEGVMEQVDSRTVAASPLPYDVKIEAVESFFGQHGKVNCVRLPRLIGDKRHFCGTALIEFSEEEDANKVLSASMVFAGAELEMKPKKDFEAERGKKWEEFEKTRSNKDASNGSYPKGLIVAFKLKSIPPEGAAEENAQEVINGAESSKTDEVPDSDANVNKGGEMTTTSENVVDGGKSAEGVENENGGKVDEDYIEETDEKALQEGEVKVTKSSSAESGEKNAASKTDEVPDSDANVNKDVEMTTTSENVVGGGKSAECVENENGRKVDEDYIEETDEKVLQEGEVKVTKSSSAESGEKNSASIDNENVVTREDLKKIFEKFGTVKFIDFRMGEESGYIRFEVPDAAVKARAAAVLTDEGGLIVKNHIATLEPLSGDAEKDYWSQLRDNQEKYWENRGGNYRGRGRGNRGGRQFDGKRHRQSDPGNGRFNKAQKVSSRC